MTSQRLGGFVFAVVLTHICAPCSVAARPSDTSIIKRFVEGVDTKPTAIADAELQSLGDPIGVTVFRSGARLPLTLDELLIALDQQNRTPEGLPDQKSFFVSEGGTIMSPALRDRSFRMVVTRAPLGRPLDAMVLVSAPAGGRHGVLEVLGWDAKKQVFNFYRRPNPDQRVWHYKGNTLDAFRAPSAGHGCFACHVSGTTVMKELELPWSNWHSQSSQIPKEAISDATIRESRLFQNKAEAESLESIVKAATRTTAKAQIARQVDSGQTDDAARLLRPLFRADSANLLSSTRQSNTTRDVPLPQSFFFDTHGLPIVGVRLPAFSPVVANERYRKVVVDKYKFRLETPEYTKKGDTFFAFLVPVKAREELELVNQLIEQHVVSRHFALCVLGVDVMNPVYSDSRAALLKYVPGRVGQLGVAGNLSGQVAAAIGVAAPGTSVGSPERQFVDLWAQTEEQARVTVESQLQEYVKAVLVRLGTDDGFDAFIQLAESHRQRFRKHSLFEFSLLFPTTDIPARGSLQMRPDATISK